MMINEFNNNFLKPCTIEELNTPGLCPYGPCNPSNPLDPQACPGILVLNRFDYDPDSLGYSIGVLMALALFFIVFAFAMLKRMLSRMA